MWHLGDLTGHPVARAASLQAVGTVLGVCAGIVIARLGSPEVKGTASAFAAAVILTSTVVSVDLPQQTLVHGRSTNRLGDVKATLLVAWRGYLVLGAVAMVVAFLFAPSAIWIVVGGAAFLVCTQAAVASNGVSGPTSSAMSALTQQVVMVVGALAFGLADRLDEDTVRVIVVLSYLTPVPMLWRRLSRAGPGVRPALPVVWGLVRRGLRWQPARLCQYLLMRLDMLVVFVFLGSAAAGIYSVGLSAASLVGVVPTQFANAVLHIGTHGDVHDIRAQIRGAVITSLIASIPLVVFGGWLLPYVYGAAFADAYGVLLWCLPGVIALGVNEVLGNRLRMLGGARDLTGWNAVGLIVMSGAIALTIDPLGITGVAMGSSAGAVVAAAGLYASYAQRRSNDPSPGST